MYTFITYFISFHYLTTLRYSTLQRMLHYISLVIIKKKKILIISFTNIYRYTTTLLTKHHNETTYKQEEKSNKYMRFQHSV